MQPLIFRRRTFKSLGKKRRWIQLLTSRLSTVSPEGNPSSFKSSANLRCPITRNPAGALPLWIAMTASFAAMVMPGSSLCALSACCTVIVLSLSVVDAADRLGRVFPLIPEAIEALRQRDRLMLLVDHARRQRSDPQEALASQHKDLGGLRVLDTVVVPGQFAMRQDRGDLLLRLCGDLFDRFNDNVSMSKKHLFPLLQFSWGLLFPSHRDTPHQRCKAERAETASSLFFRSEPL